MQQMRSTNPSVSFPLKQQPALPVVALEIIKQQCCSNDQCVTFINTYLSLQDLVLVTLANQ